MNALFNVTIRKEGTTGHCVLPDGTAAPTSVLAKKLNLNLIASRTQLAN